MSFARAVAVAVIFVWLGMVLAISFLEAPLKFRAPNVTLQIGAVRPRLNRRTDQVLAGLDAPRSRGHYVYVGLEAIKTLALAAGGILLLSR